MRKRGKYTSNEKYKPVFQVNIDEKIFNIIIMNLIQAYINMLKYQDQTVLFWKIVIIQHISIVNTRFSVSILKENNYIITSKSLKKLLTKFIMLL